MYHPVPMYYVCVEVKVLGTGVLHYSYMGIGSVEEGNCNRHLAGTTKPSKN